MIHDCNMMPAMSQLSDVINPERYEAFGRWVYPNRFRCVRGTSFEHGGLIVRSMRSRIMDEVQSMASGNGQLAL